MVRKSWEKRRAVTLRSAARRRPRRRRRTARPASSRRPSGEGRAAPARGGRYGSWLVSSLSGFSACTPARTVFSFSPPLSPLRVGGEENICYATRRWVSTAGPRCQRERWLLMHCCAGGRIGTGFFESSFFEKIWGRCARTGRGGKDDAANEDVTHGCLCVKIIWATKAQAPAAWVGTRAGRGTRRLATG